jgi:hypothetical protein
MNSDKMTNNVLNEKDLKTLDLILKTVIEKGTVFLKDMPYLDDDPPQFCVSEYLYYLDVIEPFGVLDITHFDRIDFKIETINIISQRFYDIGGFKAVYDQQQQDLMKNEEHEKISFEKLKWDLQVSRFLAKTKWWPIAISGLSFLIAVIALFRGCAT